MGSRRLKLKDELHYKKGPTSGGCSQCNHFIHNFQVRGMGGENLGVEPRCMIMGMENSIRYRINPDNICDSFSGSVHMLRLIGDVRYRRLYGEEEYQATLNIKAVLEGFIAEMQTAGRLG